MADAEIDRTKDHVVPTVLLVCFVMLLGGYLIKAQCLAPEAFAEGHQYSRLCYNDLQPLYGARAVSTNVFPYVDGDFTDSHEMVGGALEYPVLTGLFLWFSGLFAQDSGGFLRWSAVLLAPFGLLAAYLLGRMNGWRALFWAASPALIWYSFHNWDLLVVAAVVAGIWSWYRGKNLAAAFWFGIGCALKMYPILFVAPLALASWSARSRGEAAKVLGVGIGTALAVNLPFILINFDGWWGTYEFHKVRGPNFDSIWGLLSDGATSPWLFAPKLNLVVAALTLTWFAFALGAGWWRARRDGVYPVLEVAGALLVAFLLWNKVHSPQYTLWLLPFFVVLRVHWVWWAAYAIVDTIAYVGIFRWFFDIVYEGESGPTPAKNAMVFAVWARAGLLFSLFIAFLLAKPAADRPVGDPENPSHPPPRLDPIGDLA